MLPRRLIRREVPHREFETAVHHMRHRNAVAVAGVQIRRLSELLHIRKAARRLRGRLRLVQRRKQHPRQNRDDRDHNEQLNEGKMDGSSVNGEAAFE